MNPPLYTTKRNGLTYQVFELDDHYVVVANNRPINICNIDDNVNELIKQHAELAAPLQEGAEEKTQATSPKTG